MTKPMQGGRRRVARVLDPAFVEGIEALTLSEVRARRDDADQEETDLSHARAKLIGRMDLLTAERSRRLGELEMVLGHQSGRTHLAEAYSGWPNEADGL
mgnify:CR=1 FL=1